MSMPKDQIESSMIEAWRTYMRGLEDSVALLEKQIQEASEMAETCTSEWCEATEHVIDDLGNMLFSISEPRWTSDEDNKRIKALKRRLHDLYANYRDVYRSVS